MSPEIGPFRDEYRFLSNFWPAQVNLGALTFPSSEHAYQAAKSQSRVVRRRISELETAGEAKKFGQALDIRPDWEQIRVPTMLTLLQSKFSDPELSGLLLQTGDATIIEYNHWHDTFWGKCTCDRHQGAGLNTLGRLLMTVRTERGRRP